MRTLALRRRSLLLALVVCLSLLLTAGVGGGGLGSAAGSAAPSTEPAAVSGDTWTTLPATAAPSDRELHTAVWSGTSMLVWGGSSDTAGLRNDGAQYDPTAGTWRALGRTGAPSARANHTAVLAGNWMVVWGGTASGGPVNTGAAYNASSRYWWALPTTGAPAARERHTAVWTGTDMLVWGGRDGSGAALGNGGAFSGSRRTWRTLPAAGAPSARYSHTAVWTGTEMIVWGGETPEGWLNTGAAFTPTTRTWRALPGVGAPSARAGHTATWTGSEMIVWGGTGPTGLLSDGAAYDPATRTWRPLPAAGAPSPRIAATAVWTGNELIVWGGLDGAALNTGAVYTPASDTWGPTTTTGAPTGRYNHTAVWGGDQMLVWGGDDGATGTRRDGAGYAPPVEVGPTAPDATAMGPLAVRTAEYRFAARVDADILADRATEVWARVYLPSDLSGGPYPLIAFLHGNHGTCGTGTNPRRDYDCTYTSTGSCPAGFVVAPSHEGYAYIAERLASWGYVVFSINANRGINCGSGISGDSGLNLARGKLTLKHLQLWSQWATTGGAPTSLGLGADGLLGKIDFGNVGLVGHSRGGEGVRAAYNLYRDSGSPWPARVPGLTVKSIFEIGPVDGQTSRTLNADGTVWTVLLPMCDGDVSDLQGVKPYDRMLQQFTENPATQKSTFTVWGANHNFYNTEWQESDSGGCTGHDPLFPSTMGSPAQRATGLASVMALVRGNVGPARDLTFNQNFNPLLDLPPVVTDATRVDRGYTDSPSDQITLLVEDFNRSTGTGSYGFPTESAGITITHSVVPEHAPQQRAGVLSWQSAGAGTFFQTNWTAAGEGRDISAYKTLDLRVSRQDSALNPSTATSFAVQLAYADGSLSAPVQLGDYTSLVGPVGGPYGLHRILQSARIPLVDFAGAPLTGVRGVRLTFDDTAKGAIYVANIRLSSQYGWGMSELPAGGAAAQPGQAGPAGLPAWQAGAVQTIRSIRSVAASAALGGQPGVEVEVATTGRFPVRDALAVLRIGGQEFDLSRYPESGQTDVLIFTLTPAEFASVASGEAVAVQYGRGAAAQRWEVGALDKAQLDRAE